MAQRNEEHQRLAFNGVPHHHRKTATGVVTAVAFFACKFASTSRYGQGPDGNGSPVTR